MVSFEDIRKQVELFVNRVNMKGGDLYYYASGYMNQIGIHWDSYEPELVCMLDFDENAVGWASTYLGDYIEIDEGDRYYYISVMTRHEGAALGGFMIRKEDLIDVSVKEVSYKQHDEVWLVFRAKNNFTGIIRVEV